MCQDDIAVMIMSELRMSCYQFVDKYAGENVKHQKEEVLDEAAECLRLQEERRDQELYDFIDDFVNSQEYADYINDKRNIVKRTKATQYDSNDIIVEYKRLDEVEKYPLTREQMKMYAFKRHFEKYAEKKQRALEMKKQEHSIQIIRSKIHEARKTFECTWELREQKKEKYDHYIMHKYSMKYGIELSRLSENAELKLLERFKKCHRVLTSRRKRRRENVYKIVEKLVSEYKLKKEILANQDKAYQYRFKPREKIIEGMEIVGTKIELIDRNEKIVATEAPNSEESEAKISVKTETKDSKKKKTAENKKKKEKPTKKEKKNVAKKAHKEKKTKEKQKKPDYKLQLPPFPVLNPREKILPENIDRMVDIIDEFREFDGAMENRDIWHVQTNYILGDSGIKSKPRTILFQNFDEGKSYNRRIVLSNTSTQPRKIRFLKFVFPDDYDEIAFEVEHFGIKKLFTGCSVKFSVNFQPYDTFKLYEGKLVFLSYDIHLCQYFQHEMTIRCVPKYSDLKIYPESVQFGVIPIWKSRNYKHFKVVKFQNKGAKPCTIYIKKQLDPLELDAVWDEENKENVAPAPENSSTALQEVRDILDECLKNVDNNFQFEESFFSLVENEEKLVRVFFKNASYVGNYFEKHTVDVYESFGQGTLEPSGCQTVTLRAETIGHFLKSEPEILDFGTCVMNSCYQLNFEVYNGSSNSQAVSVRVPSNLVALVHSDVSMIYLPPDSRRTVYLKLTPTDIIFRNSRSYFDKSSSILEFPIHLQVVSKTAQSYPPVKVHVYAVLANFEDLTISCRATSNLTNFLNTLLFDMGDCSIYETIWAEIYLTNNTIVTQFCGFLDLPQAVILTPNFGFCKLYPGQRKKFKLYLSPEIKDFPSFAVGSLRHSNFFLKIRVETIFSMGQLDPKQKDSKMQKSSSELMTKKLTLHDTDLFSSMSRFVSELSEHMRSPATESMINKETFMASRMCSLIPDRVSSNPGSLDKSDDKSSNKESGMGDLDTFLNYQNFLIVETNSRREIWCKANLRRPLLEFSHQTVEFPDTPCGSSSIMQISLHALEKEMDKICHKKVSSHLEYTAYFQIWGDSCEFSIEPSCGTLKAGETITITLLAKPNVPLGIVEKTAKSIKYSEIYEMKLKEYEMGFQKRSKKGKSDKGKKKSDKSTDSKDKSKTDKSKKSHKKKADKTVKEKSPISSRPATGPNIIITDKELECDYLDLYPAEMVYWRSLEPYYIKANFTCIIDYAHNLQKMHKKRDKLYLETICKVIRPDFSINLSQQRIDFGKCLIGMATRRNIMIRNITYDDIRPKVSLLDPHGCFTVPHLPDEALPPEHTLRLPIQFCPTSTEKVTEYFDIRSNNTVIPLILCGEGTPLIINISPHFEVFRLETRQDKLAELQLKIENTSEAEANIEFKQLFEIEAQLANLVKAKEDKTHQEETAKSKNKNEKKSKDQKSAKGIQKASKYSDSLTDREIEVIANYFHKTKGDSHFSFKSIGNCVNLAPNAHSSVTILCGEPELISKRKLEGPKKPGKKDEKKSETTKKTEGNGNEKECDDKQYITQFNIHVGKNCVKNIILICTIKC